MPQTKEEKRKTAIRLYEQAIDRHKRAISGARAIDVPAIERRVSNLWKLIDRTQTKH